MQVEQYRKEEAARQRVEQEQQARRDSPAFQAQLCVTEALLIGQAIKCPGCKNPKRKDDACMHMDCDCGVHFCYACGADRYPGALVWFAVAAVSLPGRWALASQPRLSCSVIILTCFPADRYGPLPRGGGHRGRLPTGEQGELRLRRDEHLPDVCLICLPYMFALYTR